MKRVCVFCGTSRGAKPTYADGVRRLGQLLAEQRIAVVYGGVAVGMMGVLANAVLDAGGEVTGIVHRALQEYELAHTGLTELHVVDSMHKRKASMAEMADAFVAVPGGAGTLEEFFEVWTWAQLGIHEKPCALLNVGNFFAPLLALVDHLVDQGFLREQNRSMLIVETQPEKLLARIAEYQPPAIPGQADLDLGVT